MTLQPPGDVTLMPSDVPRSYEIKFPVIDQHRNAGAQAVSLSSVQVLQYVQKVSW